VSTIAEQLARIPALQGLIHEAISKNNGISDRILLEQWKVLIVKPLEALNDITQILIVIDALDECDTENHVYRVLQLLSHAPVTGTLRFRLLVTSRPEARIQEAFSEMLEGKYLDLVLHDEPKSILDHDISIYLERKLGKVIRSNSSSPDKHGEQTIRDLVQLSGGLFIWAATACRFIGKRNPVAARRLSKILKGDLSIPGPENQLNNIYLTVLRNSIQPDYDQPDYDDQERYDICKTLKEILGSLVNLSSPLTSKSLARLLDIPKDDLDDSLISLHAILDIPKHQSHSIRLHHPSFRDFLINETRCTDLNFWVDEKQAHHRLASSCIQLMSTSLIKDICGVNTPGTLRADVKSNQVEQCLPLEVQYACLYWIQHLQKSGVPLENNDQIHQFLQKHLLHWLEALSWMQKISEGILEMISLESIAPVSQLIINYRQLN
jgi:hypothetical protein